MNIRILLFFFLLCAPAFAQREHNIWYFGDHAGIDFNNGAPVALTNSKMFTREACSSICDHNGNLLFYTNGETVWNREHYIMLNGTGLNGNTSSTQGALIIPWPGQKSKYYIFTADADESVAMNGLQYSVVDMTLDEGRGDIITKNIPLAAPTTEKLTATYHSNKRDIWVMTLTPRGDLYIYLVTSIGIQPPIVLRLGVSNKINLAYGYMKVSPNGKKIAAIASGETVLESDQILLLDFDPSTGTPSHFEILQPPSRNFFYGLEFSPNSQLLYIGTYQLNLQAGTLHNIFASAVRIPDMGGLGMELGPDGKIYCANYGFKPALDVIHYPDSIGLACQYQANAVDLLGKFSVLGMPNSLHSNFLPPRDIQAINLCFGDSTLFSLVDVGGIDSVQWSFDDSASGQANIVTAFTPLHRFTAPGSYTISATFFSGKLSDSSSATLIIHAPPVLTLSTNQSICLRERVQLFALGTEIYQWTPTESLDDPLSSTPVASPKITTTYTVTGTNESGCSTSAQVTVTVHPLPSVRVTSPEQTICAGASIPLAASGAKIYSWTPAESLDNPNSPTPIASPKVTTLYTVTGTNEFGCSSSATITINVNTQPAYTVSLGQDTVLCHERQFLLSTGLVGAPHLWSTGETTDHIIVSTSGIYWVSVGSDACAGRDTITIFFDNLQLRATAPKNIICQGDVVRLEASGAATYLWTPAESLDNPASATPIATPKQTTTYTLTGTGEHGCTEQQHITIKVIEPDHTRFSIDNSSGDPGDIVMVPVYAQTQHTLPDTLGTLHLQLHTDAFAFEPVGCSPGVFSQNTMDNTLTMSIELDNVILTQPKQLLTQIQGRVLISSSSDIPIHLDQAQVQECQQRDMKDGTLHLTGCSVRNRVVLRKSSLSITPNPVNEKAEIMIVSDDPGEQTIAFYNAQGQKVWLQTFVQNLTQQSYSIAVDHFPAGVYEAILYCPSGTMTATMYVAH